MVYSFIKLRKLFELQRIYLLIYKFAYSLGFFSFLFLLFFEEDMLFARLGNIHLTICYYITDLLFNETISNCPFL